MKDVVVIVPAGRAGRTVASLLHEVEGLTHARAHGIIAAGLVRRAGIPVRSPAERVRTGDTIEARYDPQSRYKMSPPRTKAHGFKVVLEDDDLIVVDKTPGLLTVPAPGKPDDSLADRVAARDAARGVRQPRVWVIHRIDRFTSGLVLFARTRQAADHLVAQFASRSPLREYLAMCEGIPEQKERHLVTFLVEDPASLRVRPTRNAKRGLKAICTYTVERELRGAALLRVRLETGRRNQIRVQLAHHGHPLIGDRTYGRESDQIGRVALHAARLAFVHPRTGKPVRVESPLPRDMTALLRRLSPRKEDTGGSVA